MSHDFPKEYFQRYDDSSDHNFYQMPRKVVHIDDDAIANLRDYYAQVLPQDSILLDLMSSWRSHLPDSLNIRRVYGLGMNSPEMADNPQLDEHIVHSLNDNPVLPYENDKFDAALCAVSVQYLIDPVAVFKEVKRVLKPKGIFVVSFSNRCFPTKAVAVWHSTSDRQHIVLVTQYFEAADFTNIDTAIKTPERSDPLFIVSGKK